jgi:hypothetical protein
MRSMFSRIVVVVGLAAACFAEPACANGPPAGTSQLAHDVGTVAVEALPPVLQSVGELAVNALIQLSEHEGWTKEQFRAAVQAADLAVDAVPARTPTKALPLDDAARDLARAYIAKLEARGR